jgi:aminoglycoside 3-N-acetyltransferase
MTRTTVVPSDVTDALLSVGIQTSSTVLVHSDAIIAAQFPPMSAEERVDQLIAAIEAVIGESGTLVMPAFSYSFAKNEPFDVLHTPSVVGMVSERFRTRPNVFRSTDPLFSLACRGPLAQELCAIPMGECFGPKSAFAALHRKNAQIVDLGCSLSRGGTFVHYVETVRGVGYRYNKIFSGTIVLPSGEGRECSVTYNVRDLTRNSERDFRRLQTRLADQGKLRSASVGRSRVIAVTANDLFDTAWQMLDEDPTSLIAEGAEK